ncbi:putative mitochondrial Cop-coated vesicle membrane protein p24 precursor [Leptomonas pyrrhocoris]|uniref:Putative mitochondrial Cop-coated vesicle membrane protein p24 n=1 Tax=Leptomonas pyrrhocoris TaxID=157538 RepID=A0A0N0VH64_LEPPY|nr:putative mitochondrial Cop-coated vesicle membrane protein p24 precursor [Leptomonas pyrrhocoris]KPA84774.1 putative mitochondrial Cop-coated vesicle membrane protein p24 precursor [Leptomonas pyrrhocoris]|eukprot:XP_015663213.1 putative mitochondrial Cop-coated vesicle membrane protein p24 precursor [Leptomonas pyrrhocoris]
MTATRSKLTSAAVVLFASVLLLSCYAIAPAAADDGGLAVQVAPGRTNCFYEDAPGVGIKMFLHYMVSSGGSMDIDCQIIGPDKKLIWSAIRDTENRVLFKSRLPGPHAFCFINRMSTVTPKVVSFSVMVGEAEVAGPNGGMPVEKDSLYRSIKRLQEGLGEIEELQQLMRVREQDHRATTEVANTRVVVFCILEIIFIAGMGAGSVVYLRKLFVTKRMV